jgi:hypothetical protein
LAPSSSDLAGGVDVATPHRAPRADRATRADLIVRVDRALFWGMGVGVLLMLEPFWANGLKVGFFVTLACTVLEIVTGHMLPEKGES